MSKLYKQKSVLELMSFRRTRLALIKVLCLSGDIRHIYIRVRLDRRINNSEDDEISNQECRRSLWICLIIAQHFSVYDLFSSQCFSSY
jgi:hypothetical protein